MKSGTMRFGLALDFGSRERQLDAQLERFVPVLHAAESYGFESVWVGENYATGPGAKTDFHTASSFLVMAALSARTRLRVGCGVTLLQAWHPLKLAYDTAVLDQLTGGRLTVGVGLGPPIMAGRFRTEALNAPRIDDELAAVRALWGGADGYRGRHLEISGGIYPPPAAASGPRLLIGGGVVAAARRAASIGDGWYASSAYSMARIAELASTYLSACPSSPGDVAINRLTVLADSAARGRERGRKYAGKILSAYGAVGALDDRGAPLPPGPIDVDRALEATSIVGGVDDAAAALESYAKVGVTEVQFRIAPQDMPIKQVLETLRILGEDVIPRSRASELT